MTLSCDKIHSQSAPCGSCFACVSNERAAALAEVARLRAWIMEKQAGAPGPCICGLLGALDSREAHRICEQAREKFECHFSGHDAPVMTAPGLTAEALDELERLLSAARPLPWKQGDSTHRLADATGYEVADFHHGHEQVTVAALANAAPALIAAARERDALNTKMTLALGGMRGADQLREERDALRAQLAASESEGRAQFDRLRAHIDALKSERDRLAAALTDMCGAFVPTDHPVLIEALALLLTPPAPDRSEAEAVCRGCDADGSGYMLTHTCGKEPSRD